MIIVEKRPLPDDPTPTDAPPSYDTLSEGQKSSTQAQDYKYNLIDHHGPSSAQRPPLSPPAKSPTPSSSGSKGKARAVNWFTFSSAESRTAREVRNTVLGLVRDLIQEHITNSPATAGILQSCAEACSSRSLSLSSILQERSIENHTPLYWAIVKRPPDERQEEDTQGPDLLTALISYASPLTPQTITEVRLACLATSDQALFQRLRLSPEFAPVSGIDQMLLGGTIPPEEVILEDMAEEGGGSFAVNFVIPQFHKRMVVSKEIALEFIARSRMWRLAFFVAPEPKNSTEPPSGSWCISLSLLETSPPTSIDSRILIAEAQPTKPPESPHDPPSPKKSPFKLPSSKHRSSTISIRLKSTQQLEAARKGNKGVPIVVSMEDSTMGANLQYGNNPYIGLDEKLRVRFEARLGKPDTECIIC